MYHLKMACLDIRPTTLRVKGLVQLIIVLFGGFPFVLFLNFLLYVLASTLLARWPGNALAFVGSSHVCKYVCVHTQ